MGSRRAGSSLGLGGANIPGGSSSRGSDVTSKNVWKRGGGGGAEEKSASLPLLHVTCRPRGTFFKVDY